MSSNKNKPQWLIDAEKAIEEFKDTKYGKMSDSEFRQIQGAINGGRTTGGKNLLKYYATTDSETISKNSKIGANATSELWKNGPKEKLDEITKKTTAPLYNRPMSQETKDKTPFGANFNSKKVKCEHCGKSVTAGGYGKGHGDKCHVVRIKELLQYVTNEWMPLETLCKVSNKSIKQVKTLVFNFEKSKECFETTTRIKAGLKGRGTVVRKITK